MNEKRPLPWPITAALGAAGALLTGVGGPLGFVLVLAAAPLAWRRNRAMGLAGLLVGFGATWLLLMEIEVSSGGVLRDPAPWLAIGVVPLAGGVALGLAGILIGLRRAPVPRT